MSYVYDPLLGNQLVPTSSSSGGGAVIGPGSSTIGDIVIFNNATGNMVSDSGYAFPIPPEAGGTGIANNAASTITITGNFPATFTLTNTTGVTFPTSGTLATTAQLPTLPLGPSHGGTGIANNAASTLTISGNFGTTLTVTALTAVTLPTSGTLATTSQLPSLPLSPSNGGTGVNNGTSTITLGGNLTTSGAFATTFTMTAGTSVTFPTAGTLATTSQLPSITATQYDVLVGGAANAIVSVGPGSAGQVFQSAGNAAPPAYSTATYPLVGTSTGSLLRADGTNWSATTSTYPATNAVNTLLYASSANVMAALATADSGVLNTSASGVPSITAYPEILGLGIGVSPGSTAGLTFDATNWLDAYATGTFTPTFALTTPGTSSFTYTTQIGRYTKIGPAVFIIYRVTLSAYSQGTGSGSLSLASLPFTEANVTNQKGTFASVMQQLTFEASVLWYTSSVIANATYAEVEGSKSASAQTVFPAGNIAATSAISCSGWYSTD